jgi:hypothetical protein
MAGLPDLRFKLVGGKRRAAGGKRRAAGRGVKYYKKFIYPEDIFCIFTVHITGADLVLTA